MGQQGVARQIAAEAEVTLEPATIQRAFQRAFGREQPRLFYAPGRVNLIGEHTDYNEGFVLPIAIERGTMVAGLGRPNGKIRVHSLNENETLEFDLNADLPYAKGHWVNYVEGVARSLISRGMSIQGADLLIASNVPVGSGLSSSAALENAVAFALLRLSGYQEIDRVQMALAGQNAEHQYVGTQCGIMDQLVTALGKKDHALLIDCRSLESTPVPINLPEYAVVICDSRVKHALASSAYNQRVAECRRGVRSIQKELPEIHSLRDVDPEMFRSYADLIHDEIVLKRVRHVVFENARTVEAAEALRNGDAGRLGQLMNESHESLKRNYEVSCDELDTLVEIAQGLPGVAGARMTGGGFGGCTVNLVRKDAVPEFVEAVCCQYNEAFGQEPYFYVTTAADGVQEILESETVADEPGYYREPLQETLNQELNSRFAQAFSGDLEALLEFAQLQMPSLVTPERPQVIQARLYADEGASPLPSLAEIRRGEVRLTVSREFGIRLYYRDRQLTTDMQNIPMEYPWFLHDPEDPDDIAGYAARHVGRGSRGESPWPENQWPLIGGVQQGEQNWPHADAAFGPYQLQLAEQAGQAAILLSWSEDGPNPYGVIPRGLFTVLPDQSVLLALQHDNHSTEGLSWAPWFVLGFGMPQEGTIRNPSTILAFPDEQATDPVQETMNKVWNYMSIGGQKIALINPHAKTLNEPFKKLYRDTNWSLIASKGQEYFILTRSIQRHDEQFFPFLEHGRYFIEVEHAGPRVPPGETSTVMVKHDMIPLEIFTAGKLKTFSRETDAFQQEVKQMLASLVDKLGAGQLLSAYRY